MWKITKVILSKFKHTSLNQTTYIEYTPTAREQIILGTNGSGKSSLVRECNPLPGIQEDFETGGYKEVHLVSGEHTYILRTSFEHPVSHTFEMDGVQINDSRNVTRQKQLVLEHFNMTYEIRDMLLGAETFPNMSPSRRRDWMTMLPAVSYDYAIRTYDRLRTAARDATGALKEDRKRLALETSKRMSEDDILALKQEIDDIQVTLDDLQDLRAPIQEAPGGVLNHTTALLDKLDVITRKMQTMRPTWAQAQSIATLDVVVNEIESLRLVVTQHQTLIGSYTQDHQTAADKLHLLQQAGDQHYQALVTRQDTLQADIASIVDKWRTGVVSVDTAALARAINTSVDAVCHAVLEVLADFPTNDDLYTTIAYAEAKDRSDALQATIIGLDNALMRAEAQLEHHRQHVGRVEVACPKCDHTFMPRVSPQVIDQQVLKIDTDKAMRAVLHADLAVVAKYIKDFETYRQQYLTIQTLIRGNPHTAGLWSHIVTQDWMRTQPSQISWWLSIAAQEADSAHEVHRLSEDLHRTQDLLKGLETVGDATLVDLEADMLRLQILVETHTKAYSESYGRLQTTQAFKRQILMYQDLRKQLLDTYTDLDQKQVVYLESEFQTWVLETIRDLQMQIGRKHETYIAAQAQSAVVANLSATIESRRIRSEGLQIMVKEMSPTEGLIADGMLGFINAFLNQVNALVAQIWTYPLVIQPCGMDVDGGVELTYKFPMSVGFQHRTVKDISKGSTGIKQIIGLAFSVVAMQYLGLSTAPLYLDEFGSGFDPEHRHKASRVISDLMEIQHFTQLFMISHYAECYEPMANAEVLVLCDSNITAPSTANRHVVMH